MAVSTPTITPGGSIGPITGPFTEPITGPITGTVNPNLGNLWKEDFTISTYQNKYLDATGVQRIWKRTLEEIHASINSASAKIFRANFSYDQVNDDEEPYLTLSSSNVEDNAIISWLLDADKDVMIDASIDEGDPKRHYLYSSTEDNGVVKKFWLSISDCDIYFIKVTGNTSSLTLTQYSHEYRDIYGNNLTSYLRKTTVNTTQNTIAFGRGNNKENSLIISVDNSTGKLTFTDNSNNSIAFTSTPNAVTTGASEVLSADYIIVGNGNKTIKDSSYKVLSTGNITAGDGTHLPTAGSVVNYVTSAIEDAIEDATDDLVAIAEGKTKAYTISATSYTENSGFNSTDATITLSINQSIKTAEGISVNIADLKRGDIIFLTDNDLPDRWVSVISKDTVGFNAVEGKVDLSSYQTKLAKTGDLDKPIYVSAAGTISECTKYAGGTSINLNGVNEAGRAVTFYAPISLGNAGTILKVNSDKTGFTYDTDCNPTAHAVVDKTYGGATDGLYGHVKLVRGDVDDYNSKNETVGEALAADAYHTHSNYIRKTVSSGTYSKTISDVQDSFTITIKNNNANQTVFKQAENYFNLWVKGQDSKPSQDWKFLSSGKIIRTPSNSQQSYLIVDTSMALTEEEIDTILANTTTD